MERKEIELICDFREGRPVRERIPVDQIGENQYRLVGSPGFVPGVASGDEIELTPGEGLGYRVKKRSGNLCIQLF
jgi:Domain of unknown function (DUF4265)